MCEKREMGTLEVDKSLKAAFKETLEPHGFKKVKGMYPHFVRMATPEIIQVINYRLEQALSPQLEEKRFEVVGGDKKRSATKKKSDLGWIDRLEEIDAALDDF